MVQEPIGDVEITSWVESVCYKLSGTVRTDRMDGQDRFVGPFAAFELMRLGPLEHPTNLLEL